MAKSISIDQREAPKKAATSPYRLPDTVTPIAYRLTIEPDLEKLTYNGAVEIDLDVRVPTKEVVVNALDLKIVGASLGKVPPGRRWTTRRSDLPLPSTNRSRRVRPRSSCALPV